MQTNTSYLERNELIAHGKYTYAQTQRTTSSDHLKFLMKLKLFEFESLDGKKGSKRESKMAGILLFCSLSWPMSLRHNAWNKIANEL